MLHTCLKYVRTYLALLLLPAMYLPLVCSNSYSGYITKPSNEVNFIPDTSVNNLLLLANSFSFENFTDSVHHTLQETASKPFPFVAFLNSTGSEYCLAYHYYGSATNAFNLFEIGLTKEDTEHLNFIPTRFEHFTTESGIAPGMRKEDAIKLKGTNFKESQAGAVEILTYRLDDPDLPFLKRYNMPVYYCQLYFYKGRLTRYIFGFEYP